MPDQPSEREVAIGRIHRISANDRARLIELLAAEVARLASGSRWGVDHNAEVSVYAPTSKRPR